MSIDQIGKNTLLGGVNEIFAKDLSLGNSGKEDDQKESDPQSNLGKENYPHSKHRNPFAKEFLLQTTTPLKFSRTDENQVLFSSNNESLNTAQDTASLNSNTGIVENDIDNENDLSVGDASRDGKTSGADVNVLEKAQAFFSTKFGQDNSASYEEWHTTILGRAGILEGQRFFNNIDTDGSGTIEKNEFLNAVEHNLIQDFSDQKTIAFKINSEFTSDDELYIESLLKENPIDTPDLDHDQPNDQRNPSADGKSTLISFNTERSKVFLDESRAKKFVDHIQSLEVKPDVFLFQEFAYDNNSQGWQEFGKGVDVNSIEDDVLPLIREALGLSENESLYYSVNYEGLLTVSLNPIEASGQIDGNGRMSYTVTEVEGEKTVLINTHFAPGSDQPIGESRAQEINDFIADVKNGVYNEAWGLDAGEKIDNFIFGGDVNFRSDDQQKRGNGKADDILFGPYLEKTLDNNLDRIGVHGELQHASSSTDVYADAQLSDHPILYASYEDKRTE